jgi:tRNA A37 threonylcarbamoyladenosine biosynthesis protein TsaE
MSEQSQDARPAIERIVFQSNKPVVVALTGGWGEGKTHFYRN